jgi:hypothetical protein
MPSADLRARREAVVREHMESENAHDFDTTIATFGHPRYELVATGDVYDGEVAARAYFAETRRAFHFDQLTIMRQLGLAHESTSLAGRVTTLVSHPLTVGRALARRAARRRS